MMNLLIRIKEQYHLLLIFLGTALMALATNLFFAPANMIPGGFTGLAMIIRSLTSRLVPGGVPLWLSNIALNVPLILLAIRLRGWKFMRRTFFAALLFSLNLFLVPELPLTPDDLFLTTVFGGVLMGAGLALVFIAKATTGGTDTLAALIQRLIPYASVSRILPFLDGAIIFLSVFIFGIPLTLHAVIAVFLAGAVSDQITSGAKNARLAYIISDQHEEITHAILYEMGRGATLLHATGMYTGQKKPVLLCAVSKKEIVTLRELISHIDPNAFMILTDASEIRGEGFLPYAAREEL